MRKEILAVMRRWFSTRSMPGLVTVVALLSAGASQAADFAFGCDCPPEVRGPAGWPVTMEVFATLTTTNTETVEGAQGWSLSMSVRGDPSLEAKVEYASLNLDVDTYYEEAVVDPETGETTITIHDSYIQRLSGAMMLTKVADPAELPADPRVKGAISAVIFRNQEKMWLQPVTPATQKILKLVVSATIPDSGVDLPLTIAFEDGMKSTLSQPVSNLVTHQSKSKKPTLGSCTILLGAGGTGGRFLRGDSNADGKTDISDAVAILGYLFLGARNVPCEQAGDANDDGALDISDGVSVLNYLFLGGKAIAPPVGSCGPDPTGHSLPCTEFDACQSLRGFQVPKLIPVGVEPWSVVARDFDGDGRLDLATANHTGGNVSVVLRNGDGSFRSATSYGVGAGPAYILSADLNGDGKPDLATGNRDSGNVSVLLGRGDGTFQAERHFPAGAGASGLVAADLNGDSRKDLAAANEYGDSISVLLGNGNGTFQEQVIFPAGGGVRFIVAAKLNGDGYLDLAAVNYHANTISVLIGKGDGMFMDQQVFPVGDSPHGIVAADLNGDGKVDLAAPNIWSNDISILLGNGNGTFQVQTRTPWVGDGPVFLLAEDLDRDGILDLATVNQRSNDVTVLWGKGAGMFEGQSFLTGGTGSLSVLAADLTGDGVLDLVASNQWSNDVSILAGK